MGGCCTPRTKVGVGRAGGEQVGQKQGAPSDRGPQKQWRAQHRGLGSIQRTKPRAWRWEVTERGVKNVSRASP